MYERMLDKSNKPCLSQIIEYIGKDGYARLCKLETYLKTQYNLSENFDFLLETIMVGVTNIAINLFIYFMLFLKKVHLLF
ncbi:DUF3788 domain-containing protein [Clostridioides difficile]|uniref:DUF3788 domain-containing protein n=1 Tax=Clostridioides difficile TaxID=1496 RepID=UPI001F27C7C9|nr:DUF3788 domain-containing protein [Clostridioides difficile]